MIPRISVLILLFLQVLRDDLLEVFKFAIGDKHVSDCLVTFLTDAQKLNFLALISKALESHFNVRLTNKLNLQPQAAFNLDLLLEVFCCVSRRP
ncbi:hypothetical protein D3C75_1158100 [compost metagenome]